MSNIKACIFDLDGTLTNTINAIAHFGNIALAAFGLPEIPVEDYKIYVGDGRDKLIHRMLGVYGKDNAEMFEKVRDVYDENYENDYLYDTDAYDGIRELLEELKEKEGLTYLFISHDLSVVRYISDRICVMYLGNIVELADAETIFKDPRHPYTIALLSSIPTTDIESLEKERILLEGSIPSPIKPPSGCKFHTRCYMACDKCNRVPPPLVEVEPGHFVACHKLEKKLDEEGNYLFEMPKMVKKTAKIQEVKSEEGEESLPADVVEEQINAEADQNETDAIIAEDIAKKSMD